ncbi:MAG: response regulator [Alphaproteobacteria bacterium]|nr:response regulator [Alphaproteobacteria bacterium]
MTVQHVLIVDDDNRLRQLLHTYLAKQGFTVSEASKSSEASALLQLFVFDAIVMDVMMPEMDGITYTAQLRKQGLQTPILILTAKGDSQDRITGLESGADDYLPKPFEPKELLLRLTNLMKRKNAATQLTFGPYTYYEDVQQLKKQDQVIPLTAAECKLLGVLLQHANVALSREKLAEMTDQDNARTIDVQITRLRKKIEADIKKPVFIQTVRGKGYRIIL